jgi:hypothetical protein
MNARYLDRHIQGDTVLTKICFLKSRHAASIFQSEVGRLCKRGQFFPAIGHHFLAVSRVAFFLGKSLFALFELSSSFCFVGCPNP